jgi:hypothetical protein
MIPLVDMSCTIKTSAGPVQISYCSTFNNSGSGSYVGCQVYVDGAAVGSSKYAMTVSAGALFTIADSLIFPVSAGIHKVDVYFTNTAGTLTINDTRRNLTVQEL